MKINDETIVQTIAVISILLAANSTIITNLFSKLTPSLAIIIPACVFVLLYKVLMFTYQNILWKKIHHKENFSGSWLFFTTDANGKMKAYGKFIIEHSHKSIKLIEGVSWFIHDESLPQSIRSTFSATSITHKDDELNIIYNTKNIKDGSFMGGISFSCAGHPPSALNGIYTSFTNPKTINGEIHAIKHHLLQSASNLREIVFEKFHLDSNPKYG